MTPATATATPWTSALEWLCPRCGESFFEGESECPTNGVRLIMVGRRDSHRVGERRVGERRVGERRVGEVIDAKYMHLGVLGSGRASGVYRAL